MARKVEHRVWAGGILIVLALVGSSGCASMVASTTGRLAEDLTAAMLEHNDPETVRQGAPAYLLMIDSLIKGQPDNPDMLLAGARLYGSYVSAFTKDDVERARVLSTTARDYGRRALCLSNERTCGVWDAPYEQFEPVIRSLGTDDVPALFGAAAAWATWIQANRADMVAVADKARVELMMQRVVELDEGYNLGSAYLYLGVLDTLLPAALGGKPERGREHFERFIELSAGRDLMGKVLLARDYARLVFDRELHDRLCTEVINADPRQPGLTLSNTLAIAEARQLLGESDDYFGDFVPMDDEDEE